MKSPQVQRGDHQGHHEHGRPRRVPRRHGGADAQVHTHPGGTGPA